MTTRSFFYTLIFLMAISIPLVGFANGYINRDVDVYRQSIPVNIHGAEIRLSVIKVSENNVVLHNGEMGFRASIKTVESMTGQKLCFVTKTKILKVKKQ